MCKKYRTQEITDKHKNKSKASEQNIVQNVQKA